MGTSAHRNTHSVAGPSLTGPTDWGGGANEISGSTCFLETV